MQVTRAQGLEPSYAAFTGKLAGISVGNKGSGTPSSTPWVAGSAGSGLSPLWHDSGLGNFQVLWPFLSFLGSQCCSISPVLFSGHFLVKSCLYPFPQLFQLSPWSSRVPFVPLSSGRLSIFPSHVLDCSSVSRGCCVCCIVELDPRHPMLPLVVPGIFSHTHSQCRFLPGGDIRWHTEDLGTRCRAVPSACPLLRQIGSVWPD